MKLSTLILWCTGRFLNWKFSLVGLRINKCFWKRKLCSAWNRTSQKTGPTRENFCRFCFTTWSDLLSRQVSASCTMKRKICACNEISNHKSSFHSLKKLFYGQNWGEFRKDNEVSLTWSLLSSKCPAEHKLFH